MGIENVVYERVAGFHADERRKLCSLFNERFNAKQVKYVDALTDSFLGGHYHGDYKELYALALGKCVFYLKELKAEIAYAYFLEPGYTLLIPERIAHKTLIKKDSILIGCTEKPYNEGNDIKHEFKTKHETMIKTLSGKIDWGLVRAPKTLVCELV